MDDGINRQHPFLRTSTARQDPYLYLQVWECTVGHPPQGSLSAMGLPLFTTYPLQAAWRLQYMVPMLKFLLTYHPRGTLHHPLFHLLFFVRVCLLPK